MTRSTTTQAWRCTVCGYVHEGPEPPDECPVCGATRDDFEPFEPTPAAAAEPPDTWRCLVCRHEHRGAEPPAECPVCGAQNDRFEPLTEKTGPLPPGSAAARIVIVGAGIAGVSAAESARSRAPEAAVTLVSREPVPPYHRLNLTRYLAGDVSSAERLLLHPESWYREHNLDLLLGEEAAAISPDSQQVELRTGGTLPFDQLVLTAGAHPFIPPLPGADLPGVTALRTLPQAQYVLDRIQAGATCVCIGGGILGLECAAALAGRGAEVTVLEGFDWLLPRQLNPRAGERLKRFVIDLGVSVRTSALTRELTGNGHVAGVHLEDGTELKADLVVMAVGVRSNTALARQAGLAVNRGVVVDDHLRTSAPRIFAAGDVAEHRGEVYGLWAPARFQGAIAGLNVAGRDAVFGGMPRATTMKVVGLPLFSIGRVEATDAGYREIDDEFDGHYARFLFHGNRLAGAILLGETSLSARVKKAVESGEDLSPLLRRHPSAEHIIEFFQTR